MKTMRCEERNEKFIETAYKRKHEEFLGPSKSISMKLEKNSIYMWLIKKDYTIKRADKNVYFLYSVYL